MKTSTLQIPILKTKRLNLEPLSKEHSDGMFQMWRNSKVQLHSGMALDENGIEIDLPAKTSTDSDRLISFWLKAAAKGWGFRWAVLLAKNSTFIGHIGFNSLSECSEIAYHMNPDYWGNGLMTEAAETAISWRRERGTTEIEAFIEPANTASIKLAERLGMHPTEQFSDGARRYRKPL